MITRNLYVGLIGADVAERQRTLVFLAEVGGPLGASNLTELDADGEFGSRTQARVKEFQARNHLAVDGEIGPQTDAQMDALFQLALRQGPLDKAAPVQEAN